MRRVGSGEVSGLTGYRLFRRLRLVPQRIHLGERGVFAASCRARPSARSMAAKRRSNLRLVCAQHAFRIGVEMAGEVDHREQQIADLGRRFGRSPGVELGFDLVGLLADLGEHRARIVPVEADAGRPCPAA